MLRCVDRTIILANLLLVERLLEVGPADQIREYR